MNNHMLSTITRIAKEAGRIILDYYQSPDDGIEYKADNSPLTLADKGSDAYIRSELEKQFPIPVISEEKPIPYEERKDWDAFFLVDPLDGTKDFIGKNGEFTVNIALIRNKKPVLGVIYAPATGELYYATKGNGAFLEKDDKIYRLPCSKQKPGERTVTGSRKHSSKLDAEFQDLNDIKTILPRGSSLKFCAVAAGAATLYPRFQGSMEWDIAAGHIIATESGCGIVDLTTGKEPDYNKKSLLNNYFIVHAGCLDPSSLRYPENKTTNSAEYL